MLENNQETAKKKVHIETWGCQMNVADSERMLAMLQQKNYEWTDKAEEADLVLLNTCHIREKATHKVVSRLGTLRELAKSTKGFKVAVTGCVAQAEGKKLLSKASNIDLLLGPGKIDELPDLLDKLETQSKPALATGFEKPEQVHAKTKHENYRNFDVGAKPSVSGRTEISRFVNIAQGCNNFCTFCVVPFTRGREISRSPQEILEEARNLVAEGAKEITLLGQNVNSYGLDRSDLKPSKDGSFVDLLRTVGSLEGLERLRFTTSNPHDFTEPLAKLFGELDSLGKYIHLPVQAGDDEVLERMKRKVTVETYMQRIEWLKAVDPEIAISTDIIVGFPGETEAQFEATLNLMRKVRYSFVYAFKYSPRKSTAAARFKDQIPEDVKSERLARLNALQDQITLEWNHAEIGRKRKVLVHYKSRKEDDCYYGRTEQFRLVKIASGRDLVGRMVDVEITQANKTALVGQLI